MSPLGRIEPAGRPPIGAAHTPGHPHHTSGKSSCHSPAWQGWLYLATVTGCAARKIAGWAMGGHDRTPLMKEAVRMAAGNIALPEGAVFRGGRGSDYASAEFARELAGLGIRQPAGRAGICCDNALAESVNGTLKVGLVRRAVYSTRNKARHGIARRIGLRCNQARLHSGLGYRTPQEVTDEFLKGQEAA